MIQSLYKQFQHWSDGGSVYITSDPHFNDPDKQGRNWISPDEHIDLLNRTVHKNDTLVLLGDLGDPDCVKKLRGKKILISGNHDILHYYADMFQEVYDGPLFISPRILLSHEPVVGLKFCVNLHGHDHSGRPYWTDQLGGRHINLAGNVFGWEPLSLKHAIEKEALVSKIPHIHRITIDGATNRKKGRVRNGKNG